MKFDDLLALLTRAGLAWERAEISKTARGSHQVAIRVAGKVFIGVGVSAVDAADKCISSALLARSSS